MRATIKDVSAGLDLIGERKKGNSDLIKFLDILDDIEKIVGREDGAEASPAGTRPYSGFELETTERWK